MTRVRARRDLLAAARKYLVAAGVDCPGRITVVVSCDRVVVAKSSDLSPEQRDMLAALRGARAPLGTKEWAAKSGHPYSPHFRRLAMELRVAGDVVHVPRQGYRLP